VGCPFFAKKGGPGPCPLNFANFLKAAKMHKWHPPTENVVFQRPPSTQKIGLAPSFLTGGGGCMIGLEHWAISFAKFKKPFFTKLLQFGTKKTHSASPLALQLVGTPLQ
jgi:hypothetical protein